MLKESWARQNKQARINMTQVEQLLEYYESIYYSIMSVCIHSISLGARHPEK